MSLPPEQLQLIRAEAAAVVKMVCRAEAKAQATIAKKEMAEKANVAFLEVEKRLARLADGNARLVVLVDVLVDLIIGQSAVPSDRDADRATRRAAFEGLCRDKQKFLTTVANGGRA